MSDERKTDKCVEKRVIQNPFTFLVQAVEQGLRTEDERKLAYALMGSKLQFQDHDIVSICMEGRDIEVKLNDGKITTDLTTLARISVTVLTHFRRNAPDEWVEVLEGKFAWLNDAYNILHQIHEREKLRRQDHAQAELRTKVNRLVDKFYTHPRELADFLATPQAETLDMHTLAQIERKIIHHRKFHFTKPFGSDGDRKQYILDMQTEAKRLADFQDYIRRINSKIACATPTSTKGSVLPKPNFR